MKNPDEGSSDSFVIEDELLGKEFNLKAVFKSDEGEMFFGGTEAWYTFIPIRFLTIPISLPSESLPSRRKTMESGNRSMY